METSLVYTHGETLSQKNEGEKEIDREIEELVIRLGVVAPAPQRL